MTLVITNNDIGLESGSLSGTSLFLNWTNGKRLLLELVLEEVINNLIF